MSCNNRCVMQHSQGYHISVALLTNQPWTEIKPQWSCSLLQHRATWPYTWVDALETNRIPSNTKSMPSQHRSKAHAGSGRHTIVFLFLGSVHCNPSVALVFNRIKKRVQLLAKVFKAKQWPRGCCLYISVNHCNTLGRETWGLEVLSLMSYLKALARTK